MYPRNEESNFSQHFILWFASTKQNRNYKWVKFKLEKSLTYHNVWDNTDSGSGQNVCFYKTFHRDYRTLVLPENACFSRVFGSSTGHWIASHTLDIETYPRGERPKCQAPFPSDLQIHLQTQWTWEQLSYVLKNYLDYTDGMTDWAGKDYEIHNELGKRDDRLRWAVLTCRRQLLLSLKVLWQITQRYFSCSG